MKKLLNTLSFLVFVLFITFNISSCSEKETTDQSSFALHYYSVTDIGPSMNYTSGVPSYKGAKPSDFSVSKITLDDKVYNGDSFIIDEESGILTIQNSTDLAVGLYSISVSCISSNQIYTFPDAIQINMLAPVPEGITMSPDHLTFSLAEISTDKQTAQVKSDKNHVSITNYSLIQTEGKEFFQISKEGLVSVNENYQGAFEPGEYSLNIKLRTAAGECIFENALQVEITAPPMSLVYAPTAGKVEENRAFSSGIPTFMGSTKALEYSISNITPNTDKIQIDSQTGELTIAENNNLQIGDAFAVSIKAKNAYGEKDFTGVYQVEVVDFIEPIANLTYPSSTEVTQSIAFKILPVDGWKGDGATFTLDDNLNGQISIDTTTGEISAKKGNSLTLGSHVVSITATNLKGSIALTCTFTVVENPYFFTKIVYGNNLGLSPLENYANQFGFKSEGELASAQLKPTTDLPDGTAVTWKVVKKAKMAGTEISADGTLTFNNPAEDGTPQTGWNKKGGVGLVYVTATAGDGTPEEVSVTVPVFFRFEVPVNGVYVDFKPFVLKTNPKTGSVSNVPTITGVSDMSKFTIDYRRSFMYYNLEGPSSHIDGQPKAKGFMYQVYKSYYNSVGSSTVNTGSKDPMSYYSNTSKGRTLSQACAYIDATDYKVHVNPNKWVGENGIYANGCLSGQMTYDLTGDTGSKLNKGKQLFPIWIWFDEKF